MYRARPRAYFSQPITGSTPGVSDVETALRTATFLLLGAIHTLSELSPFLS